MKYEVNRYWSVCDRVVVEAGSPDEAIERAHALPTVNATARYVPDSINTFPSEVEPMPAEESHES